MLFIPKTVISLIVSRYFAFTSYINLSFPATFSIRALTSINCYCVVSNRNTARLVLNHHEERLSKCMRHINMYGGIMIVNYRSVVSCNCTTIHALRCDLHNSKASFMPMKCGETDILASLMIASRYVALILTVSQFDISAHKTYEIDVH